MAKILKKTVRPDGSAKSRLTSGALKCRKKFLNYFNGFKDETYLAWERNYKLAAHKSWVENLAQIKFEALLDHGKFTEIAAHATRIESRTNLLFSFEKMALRDAVKSAEGAKTFALGLYHWLYGSENEEHRFEIWCQTVASLPRRQTRVLTWPLVTVFGFMAEPMAHIFLKPKVTRIAADAYGYDFPYESKPNWKTYNALLAFAERILRDQRDLHPRDMIDAQSFMWVQGSDEYDG